MDKNYDLHWADYLVFGTLMCITVGIGILFALTGGKQRTTEEYFTADRKLSVIPASLSIVASYMSAIMIVGVPAEAYLYGCQYLLLTVGIAVGITIASLFIVPILYPLKIVSINSYLEMRYDSKYPKIFGTFQSVLTYVFYTAIVTYAPCTAISLLLGVPVWSVIIVSSMIAIFYTAIGGLKAVVWSDAFLCVCMLAGMIAVLIQGVRYAGGVSNAWHVVAAGQRIDLFDWRIDPTIRLTFWNLVIGGAVDHCGTYAFTQASLQRYGNVATVRKAQITVFLTIFANFFMMALPVLAGLAIYAYYATQGCDPISEGIIGGPNELVPHFVMEVLNYPGIPGLFIGSITAGALSSVSSALNAAAANTYEDLLKPNFTNLKPRTAIVVCKLLVVVYGCVATALSFAIMSFGGTVYQLSYAVAALITIPTYGMFFAGICCPWMNGKGLLVGGLCGSLFIFFICMGQYFTETFSRIVLPTTTEKCSSDIYNVITINSTEYLYASDSWSNTTTAHPDILPSRSAVEWLFSISYLWYRTIGISIIIVVGTIVSFITGRRKISDIDGRFLCTCYKGYAAKDGTNKDERNSMLTTFGDSLTQDEFYSVHKDKPTVIFPRNL